uniref:Ankyrin repeat and LEM domain-containing protein 1 n=1 Tax=Ceratitis capitata TaxID=7213 RepID=W8BHJ2_CERCA
MSDHRMSSFQVDQRANFLALILLDALEDGNESDIFAILGKNKVDASYVPTERGISPLHYACGMENAAIAFEIIERFLKDGADPNVRSNEDMTPLHVAAIFGRCEIATLLLKYGARHDLLDDERKTPIHYAIEECHFEVLEAIRNHIFQQKFQKVQEKRLEEKTHANVSPNKLVNTKEENISNRTPINKKIYNLFAEETGSQETPHSKYTPNRIHYNYDVTSPYYINITHRRHRPQPIFPNIESTPEAKVVSPSFGCINLEELNSEVTDLKQISNIPQESVNVFALTERNLKELSLATSNLDRSCVSMIEAWRKKVESSRAKRSILRHYDNVEEMLDEVMKSDHLNYTNTVLQDKKSTSEETKPEVKLVPKSNLSLGAIIQKAAQAHVVDMEHSATGSELESSYHAVEGEKNEKIVNDCLKNPCENNLEVGGAKNTTEEYILQMTEAYVHTDDENGLVFYETKLLSNQKTCAKECEQQNVNSSMSTNVTIPLDYETDELRAELKHFGDPPGPITKSTKKLYIKRLIKYRKNTPKSLQCNAIGKDISNDTAKFSVELQRTIRSPDQFALIASYQKYESKSSEYFATLQNKHKMREGHLKQSFIYMLIDPRISCNLPGESMCIDKYNAWTRFLQSVFYVGKGKTSRPYSHLYEAMKLHSHVQSQKKLSTSTTEIVHSQRDKISFRKQTVSVDIFKTSSKQPSENKKLERILDIWRCGKGVVCLHVFHNILPTEAYTREAAIIDAFSMQHLTNYKRGDYYGPAQTWTMKEKKFFGISLLYRAMQIYLAEGESQLSPSDLI